MIISHVTDVEGNLDYFERWIERSNYLSFAKDSLVFSSPDVEQKFIYGGDICDKGPADLRMIKLLTDFKKREPDRIILIAGNREVKCCRLTYELDSKLIRRRLLYGQPAFWNKKSTPKEYVRQQIYQASNLLLSDDELSDCITKKSIEVCQTLYLKWMLEKTMGCGSFYNKPDTFAYRRMELAALRHQPKSAITNEMVTQSFIDSVSKEGMLTEYLKQTQLAAVVGDTLFLHGAVTVENQGYVPGASASHQKRISDAKEWIEALNEWYRAQIVAWINDPYEKELLPPGQKPLDRYVVFNPQSIVTANWCQHHKLAPISQSVIKFLNNAGIYRVVSGHQPFSDFPLIIRDPNLEVIVGDTSYSDPNARKDNRGCAIHNLEIYQTKGHGFAFIKAVRKDGSIVTLRLPTQAEVRYGQESCIGHFTEDRWLIRPGLECLFESSQLDGFDISNRELNKN